MPPSLISKSGYTLNTKNSYQVIKEEIFQKPELTALHTIYNNIKADEQIAFLGLLDKITLRDLGCGTGKTTRSIPLTQKVWSPKKMKIWLQQCAADLDDTMFVEDQKNGIARYELIGDPVADLLMERALDAAKSDAIRVAWFGDTAIDNVGGSGGANKVLTAGEPVVNYNQLDGFWKQIFAVMTAKPAHKLAIAPNATASFALQDTMTASLAADIFDYLLFNQNIDVRLRTAADKVFLVTESLFTNYRRYLRSPATFGGINAMYERIQGGFESLSFEGTRIVSIPMWDRYIRADFSNGTKWDNPHRAVLTTKSNLAIGMDSAASVQDIKVYYDDETELNNMKGGYRMDTKILLDHMIAAAF